MRIARVKEAGLVGEHGVGDVACGVHALAVGLGILELSQMLPPREAERMWTEALGAYVAGLAVPPQTRQGIVSPVRAGPRS
jgi:hypothetical protein